MLDLAVFASGNGTNLQAIIDAIKSGILNAEIKLVISNNPDAYALKRAEIQKIPTKIVSKEMFENREDFVNALIGILKAHSVSFIALAGYIKKIPHEIVGIYKNRIVNIHPALLPSFGGKGMYGMRVHQAVIEAGCKVTGVTVHIVDDEYDHGPIVAQECVPVLHNDTPEALAERVHKVEHRIYPRVLQLFSLGLIRIDGRKVTILEERVNNRT